MSSMQQWFATSQFRLVEGQSGSGPSDSDALVIHAKRLGTTSSACGLNTQSWFKLWEPFESVRTDKLCRNCVAAIAAKSGHQTQPLGAGSLKSVESQDDA